MLSNILLPDINLSHIKNMMDSTGILQHAIYTVPNFKEGYSLDDNARSLILGILLYNYSQLHHDDAKKIIDISSAFLWYSFNEAKLTFRNFLSYNRNWLEEEGSQDSMGRAFWAIGFAVGNCKIRSISKLSSRLFQESSIYIKNFTHLRSKVFAIIGICEYLKNCDDVNEKENLKQIVSDFSQDIINSYSKHKTEDWNWFEDSLSYCNAKIPHALLMAGETLDNQNMTTIGLETLQWLLENQKSSEGYFNPIGHMDFRTKGITQSKEGQQPVEAKAMIQACLKAFNITKDPNWYYEATVVFEWFMGNNILNAPVYDSTTGGCNDGIDNNHVSGNQGAESTLSFLISLVELKSAKI